MGLVTFPLVGGKGTGQIGLTTATLPFVGGSGTGQIGLATLPLVGGRGTGQMGLVTATLPFVGGSGTGQMGLATLPCVVGWTAWIGGAAAEVTEVVRRMTNEALGIFSMDEVIGSVILFCK